MRFFSSKPESIPSPAEALPGRSTPIMTPGIHRVLGTPLAGPWPEGTKTAVFGLGCFWGDEKDFWQIPGVVTTAVGYAGGHTPEPDVRRGLLRPHRPRRGRAGRLRPVEGLVRAAAEDLLGGPRPDPGHAPGQRPRHAVPLDHPRRRRRAAGGRRGVEGDVPGAPVGQGYGAITTEIADRPPARSTTPRTTTSSTSTRTRAATARTTRPA